MARNQKLINYHTGKKTEMPIGSNVDYGEIVVRHNAETPELLIKIGDDSFGVFQASGAVQTAIGAAKKEVYDSATSFTTKEVNTLSTTISDVKSDLNELSGVVKSISTDIGNNYVTTGKLETTVTTLKDEISAAQKAATDASSAYTDSKIETSETYTKGLIDGVASDLKDLKTTVETDYVLTTTLTTKVSELEGKISTAKKEATDASSAYTDTQIAAAKEYSDGKLSAATETLNQSITAVSSSVSTLSANVHTRIEGLKTDLTDTINEKVATAYRFQGSCTYAELASKEKVNGYVWNVTDAHGNVPAGTNYAWSEEENKWDALGGIVDLSPYATITYVDGEIDKIEQTDVKLRSDIDSLSSATKTLIDEVSAATKATYATKDELKSTSGSIISDYTTAIGAAKKAVYDSATTVAAADAKTKADTAYSSAVTAAAASADTLNTSIETVSGSVSAFSATVVSTYATSADTETAIATAKSEAVSSGKGYTDGQISAVESAYKQADKDLDARIDKLEAISADTQSAVQNVVVDNTNANKITATKTVENNVVTLNFDSMVIDCGEF